MPQQSANHNYIIAVRSLKDSDLGIFAAHRDYATSKQRALNINAPIAQRILHSDLYNNGGAELQCLCSFQSVTDSSKRHFGKVGKNWRLGGNKLEGEVFSSVNSHDFALICSVPDGSA